jgi:hypothetical protein
MNRKLFNMKTVLFLAFMLSATGSWAMDADDEDDAAKDAPAATLEVEAKPTALEEHVSSAPPGHVYTHTAVTKTIDLPAAVVKTDATGKKTVDVQSAAAHAAAMAKAATDPSAIMTQWGMFGWTESSSDNKNIANTVLFQPVLPLSKANLLRPALPIITTGGSDGVTGIGDLFLMDLQLIPKGKSTLGFGPVATLPTATDDTLGSGKWQAGAAFVYLYKGVPKDLLGVLAYQQWSFAGKSDRDKVSELTVQPVFTHHTSWGYFGWTDISNTYDWNTHHLTIALGPRIGKVFMAKHPLNLAVTPYYKINNKGRDNVWGIKLQMTLVTPELFRH